MLLGNYSVLQKSPLKFSAGSTVSVEGQVRSNFGKSGSNRNRFYIDKADTALSMYAVPTGYYPNAAWIIPQKAGQIASINSAGMSVEATGILYGGITSPGSAGFHIDFADALGSMITSGSGSASFRINTNTPMLLASLSGVGSAGFSINGGGSLGALASLTGVSSFSVWGVAIPHAIGFMNGSTADTGLSVTGIANAIWNSPLASFSENGTAGKALAAASSGGVDYTALGMAVWSSVSRSLTETGASTGVAPSAAAIASAVLSLLNNNTIPVNLQKVKGVPVAGVGTKGDPWRPA